MSLNIVRAIVSSENLDEFHLGRLLLILLATESNSSKPMKGITKLAKFDFLLRYPNCLERALDAVQKDHKDANVKEFERTTIESKMIRFKYGPWDDRYRRWIGLLVSQGLVSVDFKGRTVLINLTEQGKKVANLFASDVTYHDLFERSQIVHKAFGSYSASKIKNFIYKVFPELETMKWGDEITL